MLDIECLSTRCGTLKEGTCATFICKHIWRMMEPDVIMCKLERKVECPTDE